ncbi:hypothetical protein WH91_05545 [Devosia psychrophila]|nr:hypothetical protein WH91_05545 [Devosia psychrophila]
MIDMGESKLDIGLLYRGGTIQADADADADADAEVVGIGGRNAAATETSGSISISISSLEGFDSAVSLATSRNTILIRAQPRAGLP